MIFRSYFVLALLVVVLVSVGYLYARDTGRIEDFKAWCKYMAFRFRGNRRGKQKKKV